MNLQDIASCKVRMEVCGMVGKDTERYRSVGTLCYEVKSYEVLLDVVMLQRCMYKEFPCEVPCEK